MDTDQDQVAVLALTDEHGQIYLLPWSVIEHGKVPDEHLAHVERLLHADADVAGFGSLGSRAFSNTSGLPLGDPSAMMMTADGKMQEMNMSFNLQFLMLSQSSVKHLLSNPS